MLSFDDAGARVPQTTLLPQTMLNPRSVVVPQTTELPQTTDVPLKTLVPQTTDVPQGGDVPQTTELSVTRVTTPVTGLTATLGDSALPAATSELANAAWISRKPAPTANRS